MTPLKIDDKITTRMHHGVVYAIVVRIGTATECAQNYFPVEDSDELAFGWVASALHGWDRMSTEGFEWARGWEGPAVDALQVVDALAPA